MAANGKVWQSGRVWGGMKSRGVGEEGGGEAAKCLVSILSRSRERARKKRGGGALAMGGYDWYGGV